MSWPTGPPPMPNPGWYPDPEQDSTWRWWDGTAWTELRSPMWERPTGATSPSFSSWFDRSFSCVRSVIRRFGLVVFGAWAALGLVATALAVAAIESDEGRELRGLLDDLGTDGSTGLSEVEADRAWDLAGELFWSVLPWGITLLLVYTLVWAWSFALAAQTAAAASGQVRQTVADQPGAEPAGADETKPSVRSALRRAPVVIAASLVLGAISLGVFAALSLPAVLVVISGASGAAIGLTVFFSVLAGLAIGVWLWIRLGLAPVGAALGGHGLGINRSWALTNDRYWFVFGRMLVAGLIAGTLGGATTVISQFFGLFGLAVGLALVLVLTAVVDALRTIVSACAHVVIVDQVEQVEQVEQASRSTGSFGPGGHT